MRLSLRFIVPLLVVLAAFAYAVLPLVDGLTVRWFMRDLDIRANLIANTVREPIANAIRSGDTARVVQALTRITEDERVYAWPSASRRWRRRWRPAPCRPTCDAPTSPPSPVQPGHILPSAQGPLLMSVRALVPTRTGRPATSCCSTT